MSGEENAVPINSTHVGQTTPSISLYSDSIFMFHHNHKIFGTRIKLNFGVYRKIKITKYICKKIAMNVKFSTLNIALFTE